MFFNEIFYMSILLRRGICLLVMFSSLCYCFTYYFLLFITLIYKLSSIEIFMDFVLVVLFVVVFYFYNHEINKLSSTEIPSMLELANDEIYNVCNQRYNQIVLNVYYFLNTGFCVVMAMVVF